MTLRKAVLKCCAAALFAACLAPLAGAQAQATLSGRVTDAQGAVIPNAEVALQPVPKLMPGMTMAPPAPIPGRMNADGTFAFGQVAAGDYVLQVDAPGYERSSQAVTMPTSQTFTVKLNVLEIPGAEGPERAGGAQTDSQALQNRINALEQRVRDLESSTVLSEPITRTKKTTVYIDKNNNIFDQPTPGAKKTVTYQRERVYRRENINEKIEEAMSDAEKHSVKVGLSAATIPQFAIQTRGKPSDADGHAYQLSNADLFFTGGIAQNTVFYADLVGLAGTVPDLEVPTLTLLNSYTSRLVRQNEINVREAWLRTEVFSQKLAFVAGRVDLTNYFDQNAVANDETRQFMSDSLVNNPALGLAVNGTGFVAIYDPKKSFNFKIGFQQSNPDATNLGDALYRFAEVGYFLNPFGLGEGHYRVWYRLNNVVGTDKHRRAEGVSFDQRVSQNLTLFGRWGSGQIETATGPTFFSAGHRFVSGGVQVKNKLTASPGDYWGFGYSQTRGAEGEKEHLAEAYYNFRLSEKFTLSFHLAHAIEKRPGEPIQGFLVPGIRLAAAF